MAIDIGLTTDPNYKNLTNYSFFTFEGLTTTSTSFLQDLDATGASSWYVFDPGSTSYVPLGEDALVLLTNQVDATSDSITLFYSKVNNFIENTARSFGYKSSLDFLSFHNSGITAWREESLTFGEWRDNTLNLMYQNIASFTGSGNPLTDISGFTSQVGYYDISTTPSRPNLFS